MSEALLSVGQGGGGLLGMLTPLLLIFGVFYFLVMRPQKKARVQREQMLSKLKKGDRVVTTGGLLGEISGIKSNVVTLLISDKVRIRVLQGQIAGLEDEFVKGQSDD